MKTALKVSASFALCLSALGMGCSSSNNNNSNAGQGQTTDLHALYSSDVAAFAKIQSSDLVNFDLEFNNIFSKIFGGDDAASVQQYYNERIHYAFTEDEINNGTMTPDLSSGSQGWSTPSNSTPMPAGVQVGALNISTGIWLEGLLAGQSITLEIQGQTIPVTSSRTGVIMFGDGYEDTVKDDKGDTFTIPAAYRQAILVHEGRHSDCTDGITTQELQLMREATSEEDFEKKIPLPHCGHLHILCTSGTYEGLAACDAERYGAYTVGEIYEAAMIGSQTDEISKKILQASVVDYASRYIKTNPSAPDEQSPNMTSGGLISQ